MLHTIMKKMELLSGHYIITLHTNVGHAGPCSRCTQSSSYTSSRSVRTTVRVNHRVLSARPLTSTTRVHYGKAHHRSSQSFKLGILQNYLGERGVTRYDDSVGEVILVGMMVI